VYRDGKTSKDYKPQTNIAMSESTAYMITDILRDTISGQSDSFAGNAYVPGLDIAGKTGTTNYSSDDFSKFNLKSGSVPDSWFSGYSTNYSISIWSGYEKRSDAITTWDERYLPQRLFKYIMTDLKDLVPSDTFKQPSSVVSATIEVGSEPLKLASASTPAEKRATELFVKGTVPTQYSTAEEEKVEIEAPTNVRADFNEAANSINVSWSHNAAAGEDGEQKSYTYEVSMSIDGGKSTIISTTGAKEVTVPNAKAGSNYVFTVVATDGTNRSAGATASIFIDGDITTIEPEEPTVDEQTPPDTTEPKDDQGGVETPVKPPTDNGNQNGNPNNGNDTTTPTTPVEPVTPPTNNSENNDPQLYRTDDEDSE
jgi:penicillin-binding protein 1A